MRKILDTGLICISYAPNQETLVLRPRGRADTDYIVSLSTNENIACGYNPCYLSEGACLLPVEYRPSEGLLYYPCDHKKQGHKIMYNSNDIEKEYEKYEFTMWSLYQYYSNKKVPLGYAYEKSREDRVKQFTKALVGHHE